jgi:hypothetical protein
MHLLASLGIAFLIRLLHPEEEEIIRAHSQQVDSVLRLLDFLKPSLTYEGKVIIYFVVSLIVPLELIATLLLSHESNSALSSVRCDHLAIEVHFTSLEFACSHWSAKTACTLTKKCL